ncbi:MAG: DUF2924 domain-containing protein [Bryobacterales bacterium]|nr:DUF2924 domain-containing protein [Bryobacterales bacterium]
MATTNEKIDVDLGRLAKMDVPRLQALHRELFGADHAVPNAGHLRRKIGWHVQALKHGGLPDAARQHALAIARDAELRVRIRDNVARRRKAIPLDHAVTTHVAPPHDVRLPLAGTLLVKDFKDSTIVVKVLDEGFEYDGRRFTSLSAIAQEITGTKWNGYRFFGLLKENASAR